MLPQTAINEVVIRVAREVEEALNFPQSWYELDEQELWEELATCILGSRVRHEVATAALAALRNQGLLRISPGIPRQELEQRFVRVLLEPFSTGGGVARYPYPLSRTRYLLVSLDHMYGNGDSIRDLLVRAHSGSHARALLSENLLGIGPKQASLFLRNVGYSSELAVLDSHVLRYLRGNRLVSCEQRGFRGLKEYEEVESAFRAHAASLDLEVTPLDLAIWIVMRVVGAWR